VQFYTNTVIIIKCIIIIPSVSVDSRLEELAHVEAWSQTNNLTLNRAKSLEIVFTDNRRKQTFQQPPALPNICRVDVIKILGVTISCTLSMCKHVDNVVSSCSQSVHALRILRAHGMTASSVLIVLKSVVIAKLVYAASSWWGYTAADDRKRLQAVIRRGIRSGLCEQQHKIVEETVEDADEQLFNNIIYNKLHVLNHILPGTKDTKSTTLQD